MTNIDLVNNALTGNTEPALLCDLITETELSQTQVQTALTELIKNEHVIKTGRGKTATYVAVLVQEGSSHKTESETESDWIEGVTFTDEEMMMLAAFYQTSTNTCGQCNNEENLSYMNADDLYEQLGLSKQKISKLMKSINSKGAISDCGESYRGSKNNDWVINDQIAMRLADELSKIELQTKDRDLVTLLSICLANDVDPMLARRKLRKAGVAKPSKQWSWAQDFDMSGIIALITK